jgi:hypothetical protein
MNGNNPENSGIANHQESHFNLRCPACDKLYRIDAREIISSTPHFDCSGCKARFTFNYPPVSFANIETKIVAKKKKAAPMAEQLEFMPHLEEQKELPVQFSLHEEIEPVMVKLDVKPNVLKMKSFKACPKCQTQNELLNKECDQCGVLFEKVQDVPMDSKLGVFPSLIKAWQDLMTDYENVTKHIKFVDRCEDLQALPFALKKYEALKEAEPNDSLMKQMFHRVLIKSLKTKTENITWLNKTTEVLARVNWARAWKMAPMAVATGLIVFGLSKHGMRNLVGIGAAILFLNVGLKVFIKGRISAKDFW